MIRSQEILITTNSLETRAAVIEDERLVEIHIESETARGLLGNIYRGKVLRVIPGMQAAFLDIGLQKNGFLHIDDIVASARQAVSGDRIKAKAGNHQRVAIETILHPGQAVWVQVVKNPRGEKGARLSTDLSISSRSLIYLPKSSRIGVSQKIESAEDRDRLKMLVASLATKNGLDGGFIVRTNAEDDQAIESDMAFLSQRWESILTVMKSVKDTGLVYQELPLALRLLRDSANQNLTRVLLDDEQTLESAKAFANEFAPNLTTEIHYHDDDSPLFERISIEEKILAALHSKVILASGGDLRIEQTQAMTTVDVNTSSYLGQKDHRKTHFEINLEAAEEVAHQLRLRNVAGIIIIDFIDMPSSRHQQEVLNKLRTELARDPVKTHVSQISPLGLVEVSRKRTRDSLQQQLCEPCDVCEGSGMLKTVQTVCLEIVREILKQNQSFSAGEYTVIASAKVVDQLRDQNSRVCAHLTQCLDQPIKLRIDPLLTQQQYEIVLN